MSQDYRPRYTNAEKKRLQARHVNLTQETRRLYGRAAHSVVLHRCFLADRRTTGETLHVYDEQLRLLEPLPGHPTLRFSRLLQSLLELHDIGHWLLDDTLPAQTGRSSLPDSRPVPPPQPRPAPPPPFSEATPDVPWT